MVKGRHPTQGSFSNKGKYIGWCGAGSPRVVLISGHPEEVTLKPETHGSSPFLCTGQPCSYHGEAVPTCVTLTTEGLSP